MLQVPVQIRPQLIPFLFKEFEGSEVGYMDKKEKSIRFLTSSSFTKYLYNQINYSKKKGKQDDFILFLTVEQKQKRIYNGVVYIHANGIKEPLLMSEDKVNNFNNLLEDIFRISFINFVNGFIASGNKIKQGVDIFIDKYDLLEVGLNQENLRLLYYREKKKNLLARVQIKSSNRVINYISS